MGNSLVSFVFPLLIVPTKYVNACALTLWPFVFSMRILPHHQDSGGFFVAVLQKKRHLPGSREEKQEMKEGMLMGVLNV